MNFPTAREWLDSLWEYFEPQMRTGNPVYLSIDSALLKELADIDDSVSAKRVADAFHATCIDLYDIRSATASLRDSALLPVRGGARSFALLLATQQVLVVEAMLNDDDLQISENAYFPRYRECLGLEAVAVKSNPLVEDQFRRIWNRLEEEITEIPGSGPITFFAGVGPDLNRRLPFSQALLTTHDLNIVRGRAANLKGDSDDVLIQHTLYRIRRHLGRRAQLLITSQEMSVRSRVAIQVRSFLANPGEYVVRRQTRTQIRDEGSELIAYLDRDEIVENIFNVFLRGATGQRRIERSDTATLAKGMVGRQFVPLIGRGDGYIEIDRNELLTEHDSILLLFDQEKENQVVEYIRAICSDAEWGLFRSRTCTSVGFKLLFGEGLNAELLRKLFGGLLIVEAPKRLSVGGGLLADGRANVYLAGYSPNKILWDGDPLQGSEEIIVSGKRTTVNALLSALTDVKGFGSFALKYEDEEVAFAVGANEMNDETKIYGFPFTGNVLSASSFLLESGQAALRGTYLAIDEQRDDISAHDLLHGLVYPFLRGNLKTLPINQVAANRLAEKILELELPSEIQQTVLKVLESGKVPASALAFRLLEVNLQL